MINNKNISSRQILLLCVCLLTFALSWHNCLADESKALRFYKGSEPVIANPKHPALRGIDGVIVKHRSGYSIGFSTVVCQSVWVAYRLTVQDVEAGNQEDDQETLHHTEKYEADPDNLRKYFVMSAPWPSGSYDHGHLAPKRDMKYSEVTYKESFYMSNICPQKSIQNRTGPWHNWEQKLRDDLDPAKHPDDGPKADYIYIITGPIYSAEKIKQYLNEKF